MKINCPKYVIEKRTDYRLFAEYIAAASLVVMLLLYFLYIGQAFYQDYKATQNENRAKEMKQELEKPIHDFNLSAIPNIEILTIKKR